MGKVGRLKKVGKSRDRWKPCRVKWLSFKKKKHKIDSAPPRLPKLSNIVVVMWSAPSDSIISSNWHDWHHNITTKCHHITSTCSNFLRLFEESFPKHHKYLIAKTSVCHIFHFIIMQIYMTLKRQKWALKLNSWNP